MGWKASLLAVLVAGLFWGLAAAVPGASAAEAGAAAAKPEQAVTVKDLEALSAAIQDKTKRDDLLAQIRGLIALKKGQAEPAATAGTGLLGLFSQRLRATSEQLVRAAETLSNMPELASWLRRQVENPQARELWLRLAVKLLIVLGAGLTAEFLGRRVLSRPRKALEGRETETLAVRVLLLAARTVLDIAPIAFFAAVAYAVLPLLRPVPRVDAVALAIVNAYVLARVLIAVARLLLVPAAENLRVFPMESETANYLFIWARRFVWVSVVGYFLAGVALLLGLPESGHAGLLRILGLFLLLMAIVFILQNRVAVARWIRGAEAARPVRFGLGSVLRRFADVWHVLAILYVAGIYGVWALGVEGGFEFMVRATLLSAIILATARIAALALRRAVARGFAVGEDLERQFPGIEQRANRYLPVLHVVLRWLIYLAAALALLQAWGIDSVGWLESPFGKRLMQSAFSITVIIIAAMVVLEAVSAAVDNYLTRADAEGRPIERSGRAKTLLPLMRNAVRVVVGVLVVMIVLSELGVDIAPLLAGAGVVGLAVGFGAQKMIQDVINGFFILLEDSVAVGDVVDVGGKAGLVEAISIRSIRLRDLSGSVHTIPFSAVDKVTNMTKDFSYYVFDVGVAYREDTDEVTAVLAEIGAEMQRDPEYGPAILEPLEVLGVDQLAESAVVVKARIKTPPIKQWFVGREFNRRMKKKFDELGIEIPFPHRTLYFGVDKEGSAPPARVRIDEEAARRPPPAGKPPRRPPEPAKVHLPDEDGE